MSQTTAPSFTMAAGLPGMQADAGPSRVLSRVNTESSAEMPLGIFVMKDTAAQPSTSTALGVKLPAASTDNVKLEGIVTRAAHHAYSDFGTTGLKPGVLFGVESEGCRWMLTEQAVTRADPVFCRFANGTTATQKGAVRKDADTVASAATAFAVPGASFESDAAAGGLVKVRFSAAANRAALL